MDWLRVVDLDEFNGFDPLDSSEWTSLTTLEDGAGSEPASDQSALPQPVGARTVINPKTLSTRPPAKIGARFSLDAVRILRAWFASHEENPYPTEQERLNLEFQTGLNGTQVYNWLANARRRRPKSFMHELAPSSGKQSPAPINIPPRPGTPMNPMQRWMDSPPDDEPAEVASIVRAMNGNSYLMNQAENHTRGWSEGSSRCSSASSVDSSYSQSGSVRSVASWASSNSAKRRGRRQTSRRGMPRNLDVTRRPLVSPVKPFQCTFCTDSFGKKYEWQRHEKSLHLSVEGWRCCPDQPRVVSGPGGRLCCVFCGETNPSSTHLASHSPDCCQEREFARKDHLKQHLRLVHDGTLLDSLQAYWKADAPRIKSRCGFCDMTLETWASRTDHLADHFKAGHDMIDWKGDWGFDDFILARVENAIPAYLITNERDTPLPFAASTPPVEAPRCAYERIKIDLLWFLQTYQDRHGLIPSDDQFHLEACRIVFALDSLTPEEELERDSAASWLRDLITSQPEIALQAKFGPLRRGNESAFSARSMRPRAASIFQGCPLEYELRHHVCRAWELGRTNLADSELRDAACRAVLQVDGRFAMPLSTFVAEWLMRVIASSTTWLQKFKERMRSMKIRVHATSDDNMVGARTGNDKSITEQNVLLSSANPAMKPTPFSLNTLSLDEGFGVWDVGTDYKPSFDPRTSFSPIGQQSPDSLTTLAVSHQPNTSIDHNFKQLETSKNFSSPPGDRLGAGTNETDPGIPSQHPGWITNKFYFLNDPKYQLLLSLELKRWVKATISPNNPTMHIPSDEELRHQARCMMYDDYDSWDRTPADSAEWLRRFRAEAGI